MGNKYTVTAGIGDEIVLYYGTEWLVLALFVLFKIKLNKETIYWKKLKVV